MLQQQQQASEHIMVNMLNDKNNKKEILAKNLTQTKAIFLITKY